MTAIKDARGNTTQFFYDANDRLIKIVHPDKTFKEFTYDCCELNSVTDERGNTFTTFRDPLLNITSVIDPLNHVEKRDYDKNNNMIAFTNALNQTSTRTYDAAERLIKSIDAMGSAVEYNYDKNGNLISIKDQRQNQTLFTYDANDLPISSTDPFGVELKTARDALGRILETTNGRGCVVSYSYDKDGMVTKKSYDGKTATTYSYDKIGNLVSVKDATGKLTFSYDAAGRIVKILYPGGHILSFAYDKAGNLITVNYPGGLTVKYTYTARNQISGVTWESFSIKYSYDPVGNLIEESRSNGTVTTYDYDANNRLTSITHRKGSTVIASMDYGRDALGNTITETRSPLVLPSFSYGEKSASYNDMDQLVTFAEAACSYDKDGNLISIGSPMDFTAIYDVENRMISSTRKGTTKTYKYNGLGHRSQTTIAGKTKKELWDLAGRLMLETDGAGKILNYYIYSGRSLAALSNPLSGSYFYHFDKIGNTVAMTDSTGKVAASYTYLPFGAVADRTGSLTNPFTYVGAFGVIDEGDGLFFMRNRYYDATAGRFLQKDPIGILGGINLYAYVMNNPVERIDPWGWVGDELLTYFFGPLSPTGQAWLNGFETKIVREGIQDGGKMAIKLVNPHVIEGVGARRIAPETVPVVKRLLGQGAQKAAVAGKSFLTKANWAMLAFDVYVSIGSGLMLYGQKKIEEGATGKQWEMMYATGKTMLDLVFSPLQSVNTALDAYLGPVPAKCTQKTGEPRSRITAVGHFY